MEATQATQPDVAAGVTPVRPGWIPALDGLRAIAVTCVILFHMPTKALFVGGFLGVDLFFVLSGFLITSLLLREWEANGSVSLRSFYRRRALRLMPAAATFVALYLVWIEIADLTVRRGAFRPAVTSAAWVAGDVFNWRMALAIATPPGFGHLWSLAVEEQFYLLWPAALLVMLRARFSLRLMVGVVLAAAVLSASVPFLVPGSSWARLYYGTDFRAHELLIGSVAGLLFVAGAFGPPGGARGSVGAAALVATAFLVVRLFFGGDDRAPWMFAGGFAMVSLACAAVVVYCAISVRSPAAGVLGSRPLVYIGQRSYAIYLWHLPVTQALTGQPWPLRVGWTLALSLALAELSYRLVERWGRSRQPGAQGLREIDAPEPAGGDARAVSLAA